MWKWLGASPPAKKSKTSNGVDRKVSQKVYEETKRSRSFQVSWLQSFEWIRYDSNENAMYCVVCKEYENEGTFVVGSRNFKVDAVKKHDTSESHRQNILKDKAKKTPVSESEAVKSITMLNKAAVDKLSYLFRNAHAVAKSGRPYTDYVTLCKLDKAKGLNIGETYLTDKYAQKFVAAISEVRRQEQLKEVQSAHFISLISDGSTDTSTQEAEILYLRTSIECEVSTFFVGVKNVGKGDTMHISKALKDLMDERFGDIWTEKFVAMSTDGASVMIGKQSGVVKRLSDSFIKSIHCSAHRLELAYKDTIKPIIPTSVGGTRWLPHTERALQHILTGRDAIILHLEQMQQNPSKESSAKARNFLKLLKDQAVIYWLHLMLDVVRCLSTVSVTIQERKSTLGDIWDELQSAKQILKNYETSNGPYMQKVVAQNPNDNYEDLQHKRTTLLSSLIQNIGQRFHMDKNLFGASVILATSKWPQDLNESLDFGDESLLTLLGVCQPELETCSGFVKENVLSEWTRLKIAICNRKQKTIGLTWPALYQQYGKDYPNLFMVVNYLLTLPGASVDAERGFSCMKLVKNDWRSRLGDRNLSDLMMVTMEVQDINKFDPMPAIGVWYSGGERMRRPFYKDDLKKNSIQADHINEITMEDQIPVANDDDDLFIDDDPDDNLEISCSKMDLVKQQDSSYQLLLEIQSETST